MSVYEESRRRFWKAPQPAEHVVAPRPAWERNPEPLIRELEDERALLLAELNVERDPVLFWLRRELVIDLDAEIETLRSVGAIRR